MRYYKLIIKDKDGKPFRVWTNDGDMGGLLVEFDVPVTVFSLGLADSWIRIYGLPFVQLRTASELNGMVLELWGGEQVGLPLANPKQAGLLMQSRIIQAFGNREGVNSWLEMYVGQEVGRLDMPVNLPFDWRKGQKLSDAIEATLKIGFPGSKPNIKIDDRLVMAHDEGDAGHYQYLSQFARHIEDYTRQTIKEPAYTGVKMFWNGSAINVLDSSQVDRSKAKKLDPIQFHGQPAIQTSGGIQIKTVMRGDFYINDVINIPQTPVTATPGAMTQYPLIDRKNLMFNGDFLINGLRHIGSSRGYEWITIIDAQILK